MNYSYMHEILHFACNELTGDYMDLRSNRLCEVCYYVYRELPRLLKSPFHELVFEWESDIHDERFACSKEYLIQYIFTNF